jgi:alkylhydroperoxidase/carboxymuconolactone decarboxylase family protein YurZ
MSQKFIQGRKETKVEIYYNPVDLPKFQEIGEEAPELAKKFFEYYGSVFAEGALTEREKALIALAVAHAVPCPIALTPIPGLVWKRDRTSAK